MSKHSPNCIHSSGAAPVLLACDCAELRELRASAAICSGPCGNTERDPGFAKRALAQVEAARKVVEVFRIEVAEGHCGYIRHGGCPECFSGTREAIAAYDKAVKNV